MKKANFAYFRDFLAHYFYRILIVVLLVSFYIGHTIWLSWKQFLFEPLIPPKTTVNYIFTSGSSVRDLSKDLHQMGILKHPNYLTLLAYWKGYANRLRAGEYRFEERITAEDLLKQIAEGRVLWRQITFIEGWTFNQMMSVLDNNPFIVHQLSGLPSIMVTLKLNIPGITPEGLFFPDTYRYTAGMSDKAILLMAYHKMNDHLITEWQKRDPSIPYSSPYEALIAASIIEKEAQLNNERSKIAGVIVRRLAKDMILQMDSTVKYGIDPTGSKGHLTKAQLRQDTLYNTYLHPGLPPTPIAMPGLASLQAALNPLDGNDLYFVAKGNGSHQFSITYKQHQKAVEKYQLHKTPT